MKLIPKSIWIFVAMLILIFLVAFAPSPITIGIALLVGSILVVLQVYSILKEKNVPPIKHSDMEIPE